nr:transposase [Pseudoduganella guangdongensis]
MQWRGGILIPVSPRNTSRTCPSCGVTAAENRKCQAEFACIACGYRAHADLVGAINVLRAGCARIACEVSSVAKLPAAGTIRAKF